MIAFRSFPKILLSLILLGVSCQSKPEIIRGKDGELTIKGIIQRQDMSEYDQGGHFFIVAELKIREILEAKRKMFVISSGNIGLKRNVDILD